jgi:hypothetical protein
MSLQAIAPLPRSAAPVSWTDMFRHGPVFAATAIVLLAMMPPALAALALDPRTLNGVNVWIKPLKFEISIALYLGTLALFMAWLPQQERQARRFRVWAIVAAAAAALEMIWIGGAAYFGIASHFNRDSSFMAAIYPVMGAVAVTLTLPSLALGRAFLRHRRSSDNPAFHLSLGLGLVLTCVLTIAVAGYMSGQTGHAVGGSGGDAAGLKLLGWSRDGGDLRVAHFFATHAMHFIPAFGWVVARLLPARGAQGAVWAVSTGFTAFIALVLAQAIMDRPFIG